ncbi:MAG: ABC transporter ATP-binding protein, partial [Firmicutes bacterium]|nr:ABC transporter ATP-binding protein [Bacillota bacterium]
RVVRKKIDQIINKTVSVGAVTFTIYNETSGGYKAVKSFGLRDFITSKYTERAKFLQGLGLKLITQTNWLSPFMHVVSAVGVALVIGIGGRLITDGTITAGTFVSFIAALIMLYTPLKSIGNNYIQFQQSLFALDRIYQILDDDKDVEQTVDDGIELETMKDGIEFKNVSFAYVPGTNVLNGINLKIPRGQKVALVGESGGGKTTICSMIPRMYDVSAGEIDIDGTDIRKYTLKSLRQHIAYVFQDNFLFSGTIRDNIALGNASITDEDVINALKEACLWDFVNSLPEKLDAKVGERGVLLSGGQKQRIAIARAFVRKAEIVIFDEATSALDNTSEKEVQTAIENLMKDRTVLTVAHRLSTIVNCDRILVVNNGQIIEDGNHKTLIEKGGKYAELYNMQFKKIEPSK